MTTLSDLGWLAGTWRGVVDGDTVEEIWGEPLGPTIAGVFRWLKEGELYLYEILAIEADERGPVLRIRHFTPGLGIVESEKDAPLSWRLALHAEQEAIFEDPAQTFPRRITYRREGDTLTARLEGDDHEMSFCFERTVPGMEPSI
jgi:hypothetical protein